MTERVEAELLTPPADCWTRTDFTSLSGGAGRTCYSLGKTLSWSVNVPEGQTGVVRMYGYRDAGQRGWRVQADGDPWETGILTGAYAPSAIFYTSKVLAPGRHVLRLEWANSGGSITLDFYELTLDGSTVSTSTTTTAPTTTTTAAPTTKPTAAPTTTTTTAPTTTTSTSTTTAPPSKPRPASTCSIAPADRQAAIEAAIASCPDGTARTPTVVAFPASASYTVNGTIRVDNRSHLVVDGNGSTFRNTAPNDEATSPNWRTLNVRNVTFRDMTVVGNFTHPGPRGIIAGNQFNAGFTVFGGKGVVVEDVTIRDVYGDGVTTNPSGFITGGGALGGEVPTNVRFSRLTISRTARMCAGITAGIGVTFENSSCTNNFYGGVDMEIDVAGEPLHDVHVVGNTFDGSYVSSIMAPQGGNAGDLDGIEVRGNTVVRPPDTCYPPILILEAGREGAGARNVAITGNTVRTLHDGIALRDVHSGTVSGNDTAITVSPYYCSPPVAVPLRLTRSTVAVSDNNTHTGY